MTEMSAPSLKCTQVQPEMRRTQGHHDAKTDELDLDELRRYLIPATTYQEEYQNKNVIKETRKINKRLVPAGMPSKSKPEHMPLEYDASDGILPHFKGESAAKSAYRPQPHISRMKSSKPSFETPSPIVLEPYMTELDSYSHSVHCPMPKDLVQQTAPFIPLWIQHKKPMEYKTRYDVTSYQADYNGIQTVPRKICLKSNMQNILADGDFTRSREDYKHDARSSEFRLWDYVHKQLFRTTNNCTYLPPSTFGPPCHPTTYHPSK